MAARSRNLAIRRLRASGQCASPTNNASDGDDDDDGGAAAAAVGSPKPLMTPCPPPRGRRGSHFARRPSAANLKITGPAHYAGPEALRPAPPPLKPKTDENDLFSTKMLADRLATMLPFRISAAR